MYTLLDAVTKIKLVKPDKVQMIENSLIAAAQQGKLRSRVSEQELVNMLETQTKSETKVTVRAGLFSLSGGASMTSGDCVFEMSIVLDIILNLMINFKRSQREASNANLKSRSKSIYRGDKSHTVSMNLRIDHDLSPDSIRNAKEPYLVSHKQSMKENRGQKFRDSLKITENSLSGKKSYRDDISRKSSKKIIQPKPLETDRYFKQVSNISSRKSIINKN